MLHPKAELLDMFPLLRLLPIVEEDVGLRRVVGGPDTDAVGAPVLHLPVSPRLNTADEALDGLEGAPMAQEQVDEAWNRPSSSTVFQVPSLVPDAPISSSSEGKRSSHARRSRRNPRAIPSMP